MRKYLAATLLIAVAIGPALALDAGLGAKVGPVGLGVSVGAGKGGVSAGVGGNVDGVGGATGGTSVGTKGASVGIGTSGSGVGGANAGSSVGTSGTSSGGASAAAAPKSGSSTAGAAGTNPGSAAGVRAGYGSANTTTVIAPATGARPAIVLPRILWPLKAKRPANERGEWAYPLRLPMSLVAVPGTPNNVVLTCRQAIASSARALGAVRVQAASAGHLLRHRGGALTAPLAVRIDYPDQGGVQVRQARIRCRLDPSGTVVAVI